MRKTIWDRIVRQKKVMAAVLTAVITIGNILLPTASVWAGEKQPNVVQAVSSNKSEKVNKKEIEEQVEAQGKSGYFIKIAIETVQWAIKNGGSLVDDILKFFDPATAKVFNANKSKVISALDDVLKKIDSATTYVESQIRGMIYSALTAVGISGTYALPIADSIARIISFLAL